MLALIKIIIKGGPVMVSFLLCSIVSLAITIERLFFWKGIRSTDVIDEMLRLIQRGGFRRGAETPQESLLPVAHVLAAGLGQRLRFELEIADEG